MSAGLLICESPAKLSIGHHLQIFCPSWLGFLGGFVSQIETFAQSLDALTTQLPTSDCQFSANGVWLFLKCK